MHNFRSVARRLVAVAAVAVVSAAPASAQPIRFLFTGVGSGSLAGQNFTNANYSFTMDSDISNTDFFFGPNTPANRNITATFSITGAGSGTFGNVYVFNNRSTNNIGFGTSPGNDDLIDLMDVANTWDMLSAFGPITRTGSDVFASQFTNQTTSAGALTFNTVSSATFEAVTRQAVVPEPSTFVLMTAGFVLVGVVARRRQVQR